MSLHDERTARESARFPRVSGDEPGVTKYRVTATSFSPRERG